MRMTALTTWCLRHNWAQLPRFRPGHSARVAVSHRVPRPVRCPMWRSTPRRTPQHARWRTLVVKILSAPASQMSPAQPHGGCDLRKFRATRLRSPTRGRTQLNHTQSVGISFGTDAEVSNAPHAGCCVMACCRAQQRFQSQLTTDTVRRCLPRSLRSRLRRL